MTELVERLLSMHERMLLAVKRQRPYPVKIALGDSDPQAVLDAVMKIERIALLEAALRELLEVTETDPADYGVCEYEAVLVDAQVRAQAALTPYKEGQR